MSIPLPSSAAPTHQQVGNPNVMGLWLPATDDLKLAVVIATHNRPSLLKERALASVAAQSRRPDLLIIVDDSEASVRPRNRGSVESVDLPECRVLYCENDRTPGASGAWNTALDRLAEQGLDPHDVFVAVLDDDDAWAPAYLETCYATILTNPLDMVAADLRRIEAPETPAILIEAPNSLVANEFLTTNPGIQGSNLFLRFSVLLSAGGFDEALRSTTDRDLCIRVADLGVVRYQRVGQALVDHYAENTRDRLSTPGSLAKREGLAAFWQKYHGRMDNAERDAFAERCDSIFDAPMQDGPPARVPARVPRRGDAAVVVGLIARNARPESTLAWIESLVEVAHEGHVSIDVVLLEEGAPAGHTSVVELAARVLRDSGAGCFPISREAQREHWRHERASSTGADTTEPDSIGDEESGRASATRLRVYCAPLAAARAGSRVWLATCETGVSESATAERFDHALQRLGAILLD
ncbi:MAG: GT2 family glycosyltransferase, partial [Bradymonadia bacterium]